LPPICDCVGVLLRVAEQLMPDQDRLKEFACPGAVFVLNSNDYYRI
jgi:hypothetical protein